MAKRAVSKIHIALEATASGLQKGLNTALGAISGFAKRAGGMFAGAIPTGIFQGIGQQIGQQLFGGMTAALGPRMESIDALAKQADLLGIGTEKLAAYRHAAGLAGLSSSALDSSLEKMNRRIAVAAEGSSPATKGLEMLGLSASRLASLDSDTKLKTIADALEGVEDAGQRAAISASLFGVSNAAMGQMLRGGAEALEDAEAHAEQLGIALSRVDAAKVEIANDAIANMQAMWEGVVQQMTVGLAPILTAISESITELGMGGKGAGEGIAWAFDQAAKVLARLIDISKGIQGAIDILAAKVFDFVSVIARAFAALDRLTGDRLFGGVSDAWAKEWEDRARALEGRGMERLVEAWTGRAGDAFLHKIEEANRRAEEVAETAASRLEAIELPEPKARDRDLKVGFAQEGTSEAANAVLAAQAAMREAQEAMAAGDEDERDETAEEVRELATIQRQQTRILSTIEQHFAGGLLATAEV